MTARLTVTRRQDSPTGFILTWTLDVRLGRTSVSAVGLAGSQADAEAQVAELCRSLGVDTPPATGRPTRLVAALAREAGRDRPVALGCEPAEGWRR